MQTYSKGKSNKIYFFGLSKAKGKIKDTSLEEKMQTYSQGRSNKI